MVDIPRSVIDTLIAEAIGEGDEGMRRVAETILNRSAIRGLSPEQVVQQPYQYTGYSNPGPATVRAQQDQTARSAAEAAWLLAQQPGDPTGGADHYFNPNIVQPRWANSMTPTGQYGNHAYYSSRPIPPGEIPNTVGTALSTVPTPRVAPNPVTISPDLAQMRNPNMSSAARQAQVTPYPATQSLDMAIRRSPGETIATIPTSAIGQSPTTRNVQSVPMTGNNQSALQQAARRAALLANQSGVERNLPVAGTFLKPLTISAGGGPMSYAGQDRAPSLREARLTPGVAAQNYSVALNGPPGLTRQQFAAMAAMPQNPRVNAPMPLMASQALQASRLAPMVAPTRPVVAQGGASPLRVVVNGAGTYRAPQPQPMTVVQALQSSGLSPSQAYAAANAQNNRQTVEDRVRGSSSSGGGASSIYG